MAREGVETWMPVYVQDLLVSTAAMSPAQFGGYMRLLLTAWANHESGGLPNDMEQCCRIAGGLSPADWMAIRTRLQVTDDGDHLTQARLELEWSKAVAVRDVKRRNLEKARAAKASEPASIHNSIHRPIHSSIHNPMYCLPSPSPSPSPVPEDDSAAQNLRPTRQKPRRSYRIGWDEKSGFSGITAEDRAAWAKAYPSVDITQELAKAHVYLRENPTHAGKRNWGAFLARWFSRTHERGGTKGATPTSPPTERRYYSAAAGGYVKGLEAYDAAQRPRASPQKPDPALDGIRPALKTVGPENANTEP